MNIIARQLINIAKILQASDTCTYTIEYKDGVWVLTLFAIHDINSNKQKFKPFGPNFLGDGLGKIDEVMQEFEYNDFILKQNGSYQYGNKKQSKKKYVYYLDDDEKETALEILRKYHIGKKSVSSPQY